MYEPDIEYFVASPQGDIFVKKDNWHLPLEGDKAQTSYEKYFLLIKKFISQDHYAPILSAIKQKHYCSLSLTDIKKVSIRAEKHGAFYHPASIKIVVDDIPFSFGVNVATEQNKIRWLKKEAALLRTLNEKFSNFSYLPTVYYSTQIEDMFMTLVEWFDNYHEFHLSLDSQGETKILLWDFKNGYRYLTEKEEFAIFKQIAKVLTLYYDITTFSQIFPWHHAAGDFIAKVENNEIDVKLTTVRGYEPIIGFTKDRNINPILALIYFLLNLSLRIRLDRFDGVKEIGWIGDFCVKATIKGFFEALKMKEKEILQACAISLDDFLKLLKSFNDKELKTLFEPLLELYKEKEDFFTVTHHLQEHIQALFFLIQNLPL